MAQASSIWRLFPPEHRDVDSQAAAENLKTNSPSGLDEPKNLETNSSPGLERRARGFRIRRRTEEETATAYQVDPSMIMSSMAEAAPVDHSDAFAAIAAHEQAMRLLKRFAPRMGDRF